MPSAVRFWLRPRRARALRLGGVLLLCAALPGCLVARVHYRAELSRVRALEHDRAVGEARLAELAREARALRRSGQNLELERESLDQELVQLADELEDMRMGQLALQEELLDERERLASREAEIEEISGTYQTLVDHLESQIEAGQIEIHRLRGRLQVRALDHILFDSGSAEIKQEGRAVLAEIARQLAQLEAHRVSVEGHTDTVPIGSERFPSNWELSAARAAGVVRFLMDHGLAASKLSAVGFAAEQPIASNADREGRARNRRIEIVLVPEEE